MPGVLSRHLVLSRSLLASAAGALYLSTLCPGAFWLDSSEFIAGVHSLGVVHPPGHPLYVLLAKAFALLLPLGGIGFRVNLFSALCGVLSALVVMSLVRAVEQPKTRGGVWCGAAAGLAFAATEACWMQSVRAEVYTLNVLLCLGALRLAVAWWQGGGHRAVYAFAVVVGLALANHHYLVFFMLPAALLVLLLRDDGRALVRSRRMLVTAGLGLLGLLTYAYLPLRAATDPALQWGDATTLGGFLDMLTARTFQATLTDAARPPLVENLGTGLAMLAGQVSAVGLLLGLGGLGLLALRQRGVGLLLLVAFALNVLTKAVMVIDPDNPDDYGYYLLGVALLCVGAGALPLLVERFGAIVRPVAAAALALGAGGLAWAGAARMDLSRDTSAETVADATLQPLAPDSVALLNYYSTWFAAWHAQLVEEARPDVALVHASFDAKRDQGRPYVAQVRRRWPDLAPVLDAYERSGAFPDRAIVAFAATRPTYLEPMPEHVIDPGVLSPAGLVRRVGAPPLSDAAATAADVAAWAPIERALSLGQVHPEGRKVLSWLHFLHGVLALRQGRPLLVEEVARRDERITGAKTVEAVGALARGLLDSEARVRQSRTALAPFRRLELGARRAFLRDLDYLALLRQGARR